MRSPRSLLLALLGFSLTLTVAPAAQAWGSDNRGPDVLIVADSFGNAPEHTRPSDGKPVYYIILGGRQMDIGSSVAGEPMPSVAQVEAVIEKTLASQGFVRTTVGGPMPAIVLVYTYGAANAEWTEWEESEVDAETGEITGTTTYADSSSAGSLAALVGGYKAQKRMISSATAADLNDAAQIDRVYITIGALDARKMLQQKKQIVWRTRISIPSLRHNLPESMELMLASAAPYLGGDTNVPVFIGDRDRRKAEVEIGDTEVVEEDTP